MHRKRRKNNLVWLFALLGILVLFLGTILAFLIFSNLSSKPTETVQEVSAVNGTGIVLPSGRRCRLCFAPLFLHILFTCPPGFLFSHPGVFSVSARP